MKQGDGTEHELNLLLEDYGKSSRQWWETVHSEVHSPPKAILRDRDSQNPRNAKADRLTIILLLEDYPLRAERWLSQFSSAKVLRGDRGGDADRSPSDLTSPPLNLLLEDYAPRAQFLVQLQESSRKTFDPNGPPKPRTGAELPRRPPTSAAPRGVTSKVTEAGLDREKQTSPQELQPDTQIPRPAHVPLALSDEAPSVPDDDPEIRLLLRWGTYIESSRRRGNAISTIVHALGVLFVLVHSALAPRGVLRSTDLTQQQEISLFAPTAEQLAQLTQPLAGEGPPTKEFRGAPEEARPLLVLPQIIEPEPPVAEPEPAPDPQLEEEPAPPEPEPAKAAAPEPSETQEPVETPAAQSPSPGEFRRGREFARGPTELPAPRAASRPLEKPKLVLEDPKASMPSRPGPVQLGSLEFSARTGDIAKGALQQLREGGARQAVGDGFGTGGLGGYLPPSPGNAGSNLELLSDPQGVDFRPYLLQILATVRRNWFAVIPESARLGMSRGRVAIQFAIGRDGSVPKLVIATSSGVTSLDRAAVAGISASNPFPPLPADYSGNDVRLQFQFRYNIKGQ